MIDPYKTPVSDVRPDAVPTFLPTAGLTPGKLALAAWLAVVYAIISIPVVLVSVLDSMTDIAWARMVSLLLEGASSLMWIYLLILFRRLVETRLEVSGLGIYIKLMIALTIMMIGLSLLVDDSPVENGSSMDGIVYSWIGPGAMATPGTPPGLGGRMYARLIGEEIAYRAEGPLLFLKRSLDVGLNEAVEVEGPDGSVRLGRIAALDQESVTVEMLDETAGLTLSGTRVRLRNSSGPSAR